MAINDALKYYCLLWLQNFGLNIFIVSTEHISYALVSLNLMIDSYMQMSAAIGITNCYRTHEIVSCFVIMHIQGWLSSIFRLCILQHPVFIRRLYIFLHTNNLLISITGFSRFNWILEKHWIFLIYWYDEKRK